MEKKWNRSWLALTAGCVLASIASLGASSSIAVADQGHPIDDGAFIPPSAAKLLDPSYVPGDGPGYTQLGGLGPVLSRKWTIILTTDASSGGLKPIANDVASEISKLTKLKVGVSAAREDVSYKPKQGEILVNVSRCHYEHGCGDPEKPWWGVASPDPAQDDLGTYIRSGRVTVSPDIRGDLDTTKEEFQKVVLEHELGHIFGLGHFENKYEGRWQIMYPVAIDEPNYKSGDKNGLLNAVDIGQPAVLDSTMPGYVSAEGEQVDFDGDGKSDIFTRRGDGRWLYSSGGVSSWRELRTSAAELKNLRFGDFDGDGKTDVFTKRYNNRWVYSSGGTADWRELNLSRVDLNDLRFGDFDGDGKTDVFTRAGDGRWQYSSGGVSSWKNLNLSRVNLTNLRFGDFDGDGKTDVFTRAGDGRWQYSSGGVSSWKNLNLSRVNLTNLRFGDFDGDSKTDVFTRAGDGRWQYSSGGVSSWKNLNLSRVNLTNLRFGDFDGDSKTDVFTRAGDGRWQYSSGGVSSWKNLNLSKVALTNLRIG